MNIVNRSRSIQNSSIELGVIKSLVFSFLVETNKLAMCLINMRITGKCSEANKILVHAKI